MTAPDRIWAGVLTDEYRGMVETRLRVWGDDPRVGTDETATEYIRADLCADLQSDNEKLWEIICNVDEYSPVADETCDEPGITFTEAIMRKWPELRVHMK